MKKALLSISFSILTFLVFSQKRYWKPSRINHQIGFSIGVANYLGDLANKSTVPVFGEINSKAFRPAIAANYRFNFTYFSSAKFELGYTRLYGNDANTNEDIHRINRNLHFRADLIDFNFMLEWNILPYEIGVPYNNRLRRQKYISPYFGFGLAGFYFNPQANLNGNWIDLQPLGTEGQGVIEGTKRYSRVQFALPLAFGLKYNITKELALGIELQYRFTFTDYLDDVSSDSYLSKDFINKNYSNKERELIYLLNYRAIKEDFSPRETDVRGDPNNNDHYFLMMLNISYQLKSNKRFFPRIKG